MHIKTILTMSALAVVASCSSATQTQTPPQTRTMAGPPAPLPMGPVAFPPFVERSLSNGARVLVVENHEQPVISVNIYMRGAGSTSDPSTKAGVAELTANLLKAGTANKTSLQIAETFDGMGAQVFANAGPDWASLSVTALKSDIDVALANAADILVNATFPEDEFETQRRRTLTNLQVQLSQPAQMATRAFTSLVYGEHPYGRLTSTASLRSITRDDLVNFHRTYYKPGDALVVIAGDVNPDDIIARFEKAFANWTGDGPDRPQFTSAPPRTQREIVLVNKPGAVQAAYRIGHTIVPATHPDWPALTVAQNILGGGSRAWLYDILRDQKGFTYGAYAQSTQRLDPGHFFMWGDVRNEVADSALTIFLEQAERLKNEPVPAKDLELAKAYLTGSFPLTIETPSQVASQVAAALLLGQPKDHVQTWRTRIAAVTAADVQRVAREHLQPENAIIVISGDASVLKPKLEPFGKITVVDAEGRPVTAADTKVGPANVTLDASSIKPSVATYAVSFQGQPVAEMTRTVTREQLGGKAVVKAVSSTTGMINASNELVFEARTFLPISTGMSMQMGPQSMEQSLTFGNGKITGTVKGGPQGDKTVDAEVPAGTLLNGMDEFALMLADYTKTPEVRLPVFNAMTGTVANFTAKVAGEASVTVPAGTYDVYELDVTGAEGSMKVFVTKAAPHIVVKQEYAAQPVVMELKSIK